MEWFIGVIIVIAAILVMAALFWLFAIAPRFKSRPDFRLLRGYDYAHRGLHTADKKIPENSMAAFENAVKNGYGMEFDLQLTKDKRVVIHHDNSLKRVCGVDKLISDLTYEELKEIKLYDTDYACPLFEEVLAMVGGRTPLIIEYKGYGNTDELCGTAWEILKDYKGPYCVESFHPGIVAWFKKNRPEIIRGQLMAHFNGDTPELPSKTAAFFARNLYTNFMTRPDFEAYDYHARDNFSLRVCKKLFHIQEVSWTVRDKATFDQLKKDGCICIFENFRA